MSRDQPVEDRGDRGAVLEALADAIGAVERAHPARVAIDGADAAGKTALADDLVPRIAARGHTPIRASLDRFHRPRRDRYRLGEYSAEGYYRDSFDLDAVRENLLRPLGPGGSRRYRTGTFDVGADAPRVEPSLVAPHDAVLLFDGVFLLRPELNDGWDLRILLEVPPKETLRRALVRDLAVFGSPEEVRRRYLERYIPADRLYRASVHPERLADIVIDAADAARPRIIRSA